MTWIETITTITEIAIFLLLCYLVYKAISQRIGFEAPKMPGWDDIKSWF